MSQIFQQTSPISIIAPATTPNTVIKGKYGYYACDKETFRKIKKLYSAYWKALSMFARWVRWDSKEPQNRTNKIPIKNAKGQKIGYTISGILPEPPVCPVFVYNPSRYLVRHGHLLDDKGIVEAYRASRMPWKQPDQVPSLKISLKWLDEQLSKLPTK